MRECELRTDLASISKVRGSLYVRLCLVMAFLRHCLADLIIFSKIPPHHGAFSWLDHIQYITEQNILQLMDNSECS